MKEKLMEILLELKEYMAAKEIELKNNPNFNIHIQGMINNRKVSIENFEHLIQQASNDPTLQGTIINNFKHDAEIIKLDINNLKCDNT